MGWKININTRSAEDGRGNVVRFERDGTSWFAVPANDAALDAWEGELQRGADLLKQVGETLYGKEWKTPLSEDLGVNRDTPRLWLSGKTPFTTDHPIWPRIQQMLQERRDTATRLLKAIEKATSAAEPVTSGRYAGSRGNAAPSA